MFERIFCVESREAKRFRNVQYFGGSCLSVPLFLGDHAGGLHGFLAVGDSDRREDLVAENI
jgi:hypothetical protein